jgi:uncharacterized protein
LDPLNLMTKVPATALRVALGCVLLGSALGVASKAGAEVPVAAIVGAPLAAGALAWRILRGRRLSSPVLAAPERA